MRTLGQCLVRNNTFQTLGTFLVALVISGFSGDSELD